MSTWFSNRGKSSASQSTASTPLPSPSDAEVLAALKHNAAMVRVQSIIADKVAEDARQAERLHFLQTSATLYYELIAKAKGEIEVHTSNANTIRATAENIPTWIAEKEAEIADINAAIAKIEAQLSGTSKVRGSSKREEKMQHKQKLEEQKRTLEIKIAQTREMIPHHRATLKRVLEQRDDMVLKLRCLEKLVKDAAEEAKGEAERLGNWRRVEQFQIQIVLNQVSYRE